MQASDDQYRQHLVETPIPVFFKQAIATAAVQDTILSFLIKILSFKEEHAKSKCELAEVKAQANNNREGTPFASWNVSVYIFSLLFSIHFLRF